MAQATVTPCTNLSKKYWDLSLFHVKGSLEYTLQGRASLSWCDGPGVPRHRAPAARQAAAGRGSVVLVTAFSRQGTDPLLMAFT